MHNRIGYDMSQHFLLSSRAKTLSLAVVFRMSDADAETTFKGVRWEGGEPVCPYCGSLDAYECRRPSGSLRYRCRACAKDFTLTSGTLFASHKLPLRMYLAAIAIFCNEVKGKSMLALSRDLGLSYKSAFVLAHKLREAMASEMKGRTLGGEGKVAEVDGAYFGGYVKPANRLENRVDRRLAENRTGKRKVVVTSASGTATVSPPCSAQKPPRPSSSARTLRREPSSTPTRRRHGTSSASRLR